MRFKTIFLSVTGILLLIFVTCGASPAAEAVYPIACYKGEELNKLREWEKVWAGKKIDHTNVDGVKEYLPVTYYNIMKDPEKWGEFWFEIVPYQQLKPTKGLLEATLKYAGTCKIDAEGRLVNWIAGIPFPNPTTALEIAFNFDSPTHGDNRHRYTDAKTVDGKRHTERSVIMETWITWFYGRTDVPPMPELGANKKRFRRGVHGLFHEPQALKGNRSLTIKWLDDFREYAQWSFSAGTRRVMRQSTAYRYDHAGGSDITLEDEGIYSYAISALNYKLLGRKDVLLGRHNDHLAQYNNHREGYCFDSGEKRERINAYVLEVVSRDPDYLYGKMIWYIDPESWIITYADKYDPQGKLWKVQQIPTSMIKQQYTGEFRPWTPYINMCDVQRQHATVGANTVMEVGVTGDMYKPTFYEPRALVKYGY